MGAMKHAAILGEEVAEMIIQHLDGEDYAMKNLALEHAINLVLPDVGQRKHFAQGLLASAEFREMFEILDEEEEVDQ